MNQRCDIAVVGAGIVGLAAAIGLQRRGFEVCLIERGKPPPAFDPARYDPRVYALAPSSAALLRELDVWPAIERARVAPYRRMKIWDRDPARGLGFQADELRATVLGWIVEHGLLAATLWSARGDLRVRTQCEISSVEFDAAAPCLHFSDGTRLNAALIVSAEGADARLRALAGLDTVGWSYPQTAIVCHVRTQVPHEGTALQRFLPGGPLAFLPLADGRRSIVWSAPTAEAQELRALDDAAFGARLAAAAQFEVGAISEPTTRAVFSLRLLHAPAYVREHFALVGDSAHVVHPLAGQGLNLGLADVAHLIAELDAARNRGRHWSATRTLRRYERARLAANLEMLGLTDALSRAFRMDLPGWRGVLSQGLGLVDRLPPIKNLLRDKALG